MRDYPHIRAWVFDLGNTLMSIPDKYDEEFRIRTILGWNSTDHVRSVIYRLCDKHPGQSTEEFLRRFDAAVNPEHSETLTADLRQAWIDSIEAACLRPGAHEVLDCLRQAGQKVALVSNTPPTSHGILDRLDLRRRFDAVVFSCDVGFLKPDPRIFRHALEKLGEAAEASVIVGDKIRTDILGGAILGMMSILVEERLRGVVENGQNYVDAIVPSLADLQRTRLYRSVVGPCC